MFKGKILIVDDDRTTVSVMQIYTENNGYKVVGTASNGREAIENTKDFQPDLVLMDIHLGKGLDGIDAAEVIIKHLKVPVIFVTAHTDEATLERAKSAGPVGFINKPLRETDLRTTIEFALAKTKPDKHNCMNIKISVEDVLENLYDLTPAEARVAAKLVEFPELKNAADDLNISTSTVRTHLKRIFRKTNTNRQSLLIHKIITGPVGLLIKKDNS